MASVQEEFSGRHQFYQSRCQTIFEMYLSFTFDKLEKYVQNQDKTNRGPADKILDSYCFSKTRSEFNLYCFGET